MTIHDADVAHLPICLPLSPPKGNLKPWQAGLIVALPYLVLSVIYILFSSRLAARLAHSIHDMADVEVTKGILFVVVTTLLIFSFSLFVFRRIALHQQRLADYDSLLIACERRATAGLFAASVAHDINNELVALQTVADTLESHPLHPDFIPLARTLSSSILHLKDLSSRMGKVGGRHLTEQEILFDLAETVRDTVDLARQHKKLRGCEVQLKGPSVLRFLGKPSLVHHMLLNLLINSGDATIHRGRIAVSLVDEGAEVRLRVQDNGPGIPKELRTHVMEPYYTTKEDGSGLGLFSVRACIAAHGGSMDIGDSELGGACFDIRLPKKNLP